MGKPPNLSLNRPLGPGDKIPPFTLLSFGSARSVSWKPGQVTVFSFCALWCDTWREQSTRLQATRRSLAGLPITYHTISVDGRWAEKYRSGESTDGDVLLDSGGSLSQSLCIRAVPWTFIVDKRGIVHLARQGIVRQEEMEPILRRLATDKTAAVSAEPVYLTFDDFPAVRPNVRLSEDEELLDILRAASVPATFFCIGEHLTTVAGNCIARRAVREGHALQIHSWAHDAARPELSRCIQTLREIRGTPPTLYRPPGSSEVFTAEGKIRIPLPHRTVNPYDFQRPGTVELTRRILFAVRPGSVIQLHAGVSETRQIMSALLSSLRQRGLNFSTLEGKS
jgi:peptidoglycan/xylan/chitin deacetylase (PgdA/CDA1 family)